MPPTSQRHDSILVESLARLQDVRGREQFLEAALVADAANCRSQELKASYKAPGFSGQFDV